MLKEAEAGVPMKDLCRRIGIEVMHTFYHRWKAKDTGSLEVSETRQLRQLEEENGRLREDRGAAGTGRWMR